MTTGYSDVQGAGASGTNIDSNPQFVGGSVYALTCNSPCIDAGRELDIAKDLADVDEDGFTTTQDSPFDVEGYTRVIDVLGGTDDVDQGAYESQDEDNCEGDTNHDGVVDVNDLIAVILGWGACIAPSSGCLGDVFTHPCGNGVVDVDDLIAVILSWGQCPEGFRMGTGASIPQSLQDCMDQCSEDYEYGSDKWHECVEACMQAVEELN